ncbi:uncharacterized protein AMSG_04440 [Thecamonas trahens ATCC 50062]|uniref:Uncharacterized protein n=1 Tax=Thecamonas trahens ATCC 50062 TaxID=461836 RepID=A0A0L0D816_THETB|nr:hypothetical protein AMSG_04440 [Thecamonas trahens ATCC 50062]KNC48211.1 hypothetical protein AMSG_04440 [Thecamonas trahens ATCC 50062]|eukprot:XP_013758780.1 hypothetical protein AMSG_04440 [Thecamonas trahens ATCC 50062]
MLPQQGTQVDLQRVRGLQTATQVVTVLAMMLTVGLGVYGVAVLATQNNDERKDNDTEEEDSSRPNILMLVLTVAVLLIAFSLGFIAVRAETLYRMHLYQRFAVVLGVSALTTLAFAAVRGNINIIAIPYFLVGVVLAVLLRQQLVEAGEQGYSPLPPVWRDASSSSESTSTNTATEGRFHPSSSAS